MTVSTRFAAPLLVMVAIAVVPVAIYSTVQPTVDDCSQPEGLLRVSEISSTSWLKPDTHAGQWDIRQRGSIQRIRGYVGDEEDPDFEFAVARVYGLPEDFLRPTGSLKRRFEVNLQSFELLEVGSDQLPVYIDIQGRRFAAYFFVYNARPVKNPFLARLSGALQELMHGRRPLTSVMIAGQISGRRFERLPEEARDWLAGAWKHYLRVCGS